MRWLFNPSGAATGKSLDEMKRSFELQRNKKFASHVCTEHPRNRKQETRYFKGNHSTLNLHAIHPESRRVRCPKPPPQPSSVVSKNSSRVTAKPEVIETVSKAYRRNGIAPALPGGIQGAITILKDFFECLRMLIIPRNSLKFRFLVDSNPTLSAITCYLALASRRYCTDTTVEGWR
jgi:hypothetical protein